MRREPSKIDIKDDHAIVHLIGDRGGYALVSLEDVPIVSGHRWRVNKIGYAVTSASKILMHRMIMNAPKDKYICVDHINFDTLDNTRENLRVVSRSLNQFHTAKWGRTCGVSYDKSRGGWHAYINQDGRRTNLGRYTTQDDAIKARLKAEKDLFGYNKPRST